MSKSQKDSIEDPRRPSKSTRMCCEYIGEPLDGQILYGRQQRERRRRRRYDFSRVILCCQTQIRWANRMGLGHSFILLVCFFLFRFAVLNVVRLLSIT